MISNTLSLDNHIPATILEVGTVIRWPRSWGQLPGYAAKASGVVGLSSTITLDNNWCMPLNGLKGSLLSGYSFFL